MKNVLLPLFAVSVVNYVAASFVFDTPPVIFFYEILSNCETEIQWDFENSISSLN